MRMTFTGREYSYMRLGKLKQDCLNHIFTKDDSHPLGNFTIVDLNSHFQEMREIWESLLIKPVWLAWAELVGLEIETRKA